MKAEKFDHERLLKSRFKDAISLVINYIPDWEPAPCSSKIGGLPNLPDDVDWPRWQGTPMLFIAQINLTDAAPYDTKKLLPASGLIYFFIKDRMMLDFQTLKSGSMVKVLYAGLSPDCKPSVRRLSDLETLYEPRPINFGQLKFNQKSGENHLLIGSPDASCDWILLLQLDRIWENTIHDGPYGILSFWILRTDLSCNNFDNVRILFQDDGIE
jgi:uncharacterized protein YwqG